MSNVNTNLITINLGKDELAGVDNALTDLETRFAGLIALSFAQRRSANKMGPKSEQFCRQTLKVLDLNPKVVPPGIDIADAKADLAALDDLRPRFERLRTLASRADDSEFALGSDIMTAALKGYAVLKVMGKIQGLEQQQRTLAQRFNRTARLASEPVPSTPEPAPEPAA